MARLLNKLVTKQIPWHANMTELNHLGRALLIKPHLFEGKMTQIFTSTRYSDNPLTAMLAGKSEETITGTEFEWDLRTSTSRPAVVLENVEPDSNANLGKFKRSFKIKLDLDWFVPGDIIHPGVTSANYQVRVQTQSVKHGKGWLYEVRGMSDDPQWYLPSKYVAVGTQWAKLFSQYEEAAEQSGSTYYSMPIGMTGRIGRYRKKYRVTGDAASEVLAVRMWDSKGNSHDSWIKYAEVEYWEQWYRELERGYWYSRSTETVLGANGRPIRSGPGVRELLEDSHTHPYTVLSGRLIEEFLMDIFYSRIKPGKSRKIKGWTGEYGMLQFSRAMSDLAEKRKGFFSVVDTNFISKTSSEYNENALAIGYQFTKYRMGNGAELELIHCPLYDDREINFEIDPVSGFPLESQRITFLDFSNQGSSNDSNISLIQKRDSFKLGYVAGLHTPYGPRNKGDMAHSGDYYEMHVQKQCGVKIEDISRCGELYVARA